MPGVPESVRRVAGPRGRQVYRASVGRYLDTQRRRPDRLRRLVDDYVVADDLLEVDGRVPLLWWTYAQNFGDLLSPWLVSRMTGREVVAADPSRPHYAAIGSILGQATEHSRVWGAGSFGTEDLAGLATGADYTAVRGPLSRDRLRAQGARVPRVFGDPALLTPAYFSPRVPKTHTYGVVARWSQRRVAKARLGPDVRLIDLWSHDVEGVLEAMLSCRNILTGSLHGLIIADAYGIPSAWRLARGAQGGSFKFFDYFSSVEKFRNPQPFDISRPITATRLRDSLDFDSRPIRFDHRALLDACPFVQRRPSDGPGDGPGVATTAAAAVALAAVDAVDAVDALAALVG